MTATPPCMWKS